MTEVIHHHIHYVDPSIQKEGLNLNLAEYNLVPDKFFSDEKSVPAPIQIPAKMMEGAWLKNTTLKILEEKEQIASIIKGLS